MKLSKEQVEKIAFLILDNLKKKGLIEIKTDEEKVLKKIVDVFLQDLRREDELDREVERILNAHADMIDTHRADYRKMFNMVKNKLAKERGIVL